YFGRTPSGVKSFSIKTVNASLSRRCTPGRCHHERTTANLSREICGRRRYLYSFNGVLAQIFERRQAEHISPSPYATSAAFHTCRIMAPGPVISPILLNNMFIMEYCVYKRV